MKKGLLSIALIHFVLFSFSQEIGYGVLPNGQSVRKQEASEAKVISDINPRFPSSWVREYVSVSLSVACNGELLTARGSGYTFNQEQQRILKLGETGTDIVMAIQYYPNNSLPKEVKEINFSVQIAPDSDAEFPGGKEHIQRYLQESAIAPLSEIPDTDVHIAKVIFTISPNGEVADARISQSSHLEKVDELLLSTITNMPKWKPAQNADGTLVSQAFEFIVTRDLCAYQF